MANTTRRSEREHHKNYLLGRAPFASEATCRSQADVRIVVVVVESLFRQFSCIGEF